MSYELSHGVRTFFTNHDGGTFTCSNYSMAIMKTGNGFWLFNSHKTDKCGFHAVIEKAAALIRFESIIVMINHLRRLFTCMDSEYRITPIVEVENVGSGRSGTVNFTEGRNDGKRKDI